VFLVVVVVAVGVSRHRWAPRGGGTVRSTRLLFRTSVMMILVVLLRVEHPQHLLQLIHRQLMAQLLHHTIQVVVALLHHLHHPAQQRVLPSMLRGLRRRM